MLHKKSFIILTIFCLLTIIECQFIGNAKKIKQVHKIETPRRVRGTSDLVMKKPKRIMAEDSVANGASELSGITDSISFSGYDKPTPSSKESFHITNSSTTTINKAGIRITYLDLKNRMLHSRDVEVNCCVPGGESRLASIPSWDIQHTFFYYLGPEPKKVATPYKVTIKLLWVEI